MTALLAVGAGAATTNQLHVQLTGDECKKITALSLVMNGNDRSRIPLDPIPGKTCHWTGSAPATFVTTRSHFSLRAGFARTECHQPFDEEEQEFKPVAVLTFDCCKSQPVRKVTIATEPTMAVSYLREMEVPKGIPSATSSHPVKCTEHGVFDQGAGTVDHLFGTEKLHLQLGFPAPDLNWGGLRLLGLKNVKQGNSGSRDLTPDAVVYELLAERASSALSPNALDLDAIRLREIKLKKLNVKVE